ncbi:flavodoxin family protein [Sedimentibacter sp. MB31-C6]|uniref:flavodoxin family protein n=1 Tax=Sedimentibacter sp. MB31-C6 TaxID=3109366 RepID=UPI002DDC95D2|nr:flavodoxin family protein [Sedimentibacter sp. MB36-C1]WSI04822.1 flavodoxin family protein [Sedimentibacter sp. MB36-C1]
MKVVAFNGSPRNDGNTYEAIKIVTNELESQGIEVEIIQVGNKKINGCTACNACFKNRNERCIIDDEVNEWIQKMKESDGIILGSPVHFSAISATMKAFLDRAFYVADANKSLFRHKVGASVVAVRRSGGVPTYNQLNNYIQYTEMLMPSSNYWNVIYGLKPGQVIEDEEGVQIMRVLGKNMAWLMKLIEFGKDKIEEPEFEKKRYTNFIK